MTQKDESPKASEGPYWSEELLALQLRRVGGSATIEDVNRDDTDDGLAPRLRSH